MIRFACPGCGKVYKAGDELAGRKTSCKHCGAIVVVPESPVREVLYGVALPPDGVVETEPEPEDRPPSPPSNPFEIDDDAPLDEPRRGYDSEPSYKPSSYRRSRRTAMGQANRIVASVGAAMLLIGQFLPMVHAPFGIWMSFVDLPWKAVTIGLNAAANAEAERGEPDQKRILPRVDQPEKRSDAAFRIVTAVVAIAVLYPVCIFVMVTIAFFQVCGGTSRGVFTMIGGISLSGTLFYGLALLALSTQKEFRVVMVFTSPGFGWAVVLIGALALTGSGMIRSDSRY